MSDRVARLLARREAIDHQFDEALRAGDGPEEVRRPGRILAALARLLPDRARLALARDYAMREARRART